MKLRKKHINAIAMLASIVVCATTVQAARTFTGSPHSVKMTAYKRANIYKGYSVTFKIDNLTQAWLDGNFRHGVLLLIIKRTIVLAGNDTTA